MLVGTRDQHMANVGCCESRGGSPVSDVRLNNPHGIELGDRIAGPGKVRWEAAGMVIHPLPVLLVVIMLLQLALLSVPMLLTESSLRQVGSVFG